MRVRTASLNQNSFFNSAGLIRSTLSWAPLQAAFMNVRWKLQLSKIPSNWFEGDLRNNKEIEFEDRIKSTTRIK